MRGIRKFWLTMLLAGVLPANETLAVDDTFDAQNFSGEWKFVTNLDATITATDSVVLRRGDEVFQRALVLKALPVENSGQPQKISEAQVRDFIANYRPPPVPYTSESAAKKAGREKFNCLEFAEDIVTQAQSNGIPAEVIGIKFQGKLTGHACAGFPTAEGRTLYFDSTPSAGHVSHAAHEARVELGKPYRRADGGELGGGAENLPITKIIPVTRLAEIAGSLSDGNSDDANAKTKLVVVEEKSLPVEGIDYAAPDALKISDAQIEKWNQAAEEFMAAESSQKYAQRQAAQAAAKKLSASALAENERLAARGDVYGELRMGERYLTGDGVAKDIFKAREFLQRAADQGSPTAAAEMNRLDGN